MEELLEEAVKYIFYYVFYLVVFHGAFFLLVVSIATPIVWIRALFSAGPFLVSLYEGYGTACRAWMAIVDGWN